MATTDAVLRRGLEVHGAEHILTLDPAFQGLPDTAHGGSVLAALRLLAEAWPAPELRGIYRKRVPLGVPLRLLTDRTDADTIGCRLLDASATTLVEGCVRSGRESGPSATRVAREAAPRADEQRPGEVASVVAEGPPPGPIAGHPLPVSSTCFACGVDNPLGLGLRLTHDADRVWGLWASPETFRTDDGALAPVALTTLLDEAAFWLGALASGESGMTTELVVRLHASVPFGAVIAVSGERAGVRPRPDDARYWDTMVTAWDQRGQPVAEAWITFVAVRGAARRLAAWLLRVNPPQVVRRVFPAYA